MQKTVQEYEMAMTKSKDIFINKMNLENPISLITRFIWCTHINIIIRMNVICFIFIFQFFMRKMANLQLEIPYFDMIVHNFTSEKINYNHFYHTGKSRVLHTLNFLHEM